MFFFFSCQNSYRRLFRVFVRWKFSYQLMFLSPPVRIELIRFCHGEPFVGLHIFIIILSLGRRWQACTSSLGTFTLYFLFMISVTWSINGQDPYSSSDLMSEGLLESDFEQDKSRDPLVDAAWFHLNSQSLKYQWFTPSDCEICGNIWIILV